MRTLRRSSKRRYPTRLGNGPVTNVVAGWAGLVIAALLFYWAHAGRHPGWSFGSAALGVERHLADARAPGLAAFAAFGAASSLGSMSH